MISFVLLLAPLSPKISHQSDGFGPDSHAYSQACMYARPDGRHLYQSLYIRNHFLKAIKLGNSVFSPKTLKGIHRLGVATHGWELLL